MNTRQLLALVLAVGMLVPAAGAASTVQPDSFPNQAPDGAAADQGGDAGGAGSAAASQDDDEDGNYTRLYVEDRHQHLELKPGESETFAVVVENGEDEAVELSPGLYVPPRGERPIEESWVTIEAGDRTLDPGEEREIEVTVAVPEDAELNRYGGAIALTDERVSYRGGPERPVHAVSLNVEVWKEPAVRIVSDRRAYTQVKAGEAFTREIVVENTGDEAVPVNPQLRTDDRRGRHRMHGERERLDRSWLEIDAPTEIAPGETATIEVTVAPPADAERGDYRAEIDLGLKDPNRPDRSSYWQRVGLRFQVWTPPEEPFETDFEVSEDAEDVTLELSAGTPRHADSELDAPAFDVTFVGPDGTEVDAERVQVTDRGSVSLGADRRRPTADDDSTYASGGEDRTVRYRLEDPEAGEWSVKITPQNTMRFGYEITRNETA